MDEVDEATVLSKVHLIDSDILVLSGSLVDGSGTPSSDFDFCVIAEAADDRFYRKSFPKDSHMRFYTNGERVKASFDYLPNSLLGVDVEYRTVQEISGMLAAHKRLYEQMRGRARKASSFAATPIDFRLLSRLTYCVVLQNTEGFEEITKGLRPSEVAFPAFRTAVGSYPDFRDLAGMWAQQDFESAVVAARKLGVDTLRGLTHLYGNTNRNAKYLGRFLARLPEHLSHVAARFSALLTHGEDSAASPNGVLAWLDLIDVAFAEIREKRDDVPAFQSREEFLDLLRRELHETMCWNAEIANEYCFRAREAEPNLPSLRELLASMEKREAVEHHLPLREWASGRSAPKGESN